MPVVEQGVRQAPDWQVWPWAQAWPQVPQFAESVWRATQAPLQTCSPVGHSQAPLAQVAPVAQAWPQVPQLAVSAPSRTHAWPQSTEPAWTQAQVPPRQD